MIPRTPPLRAYYFVAFAVVASALSGGVRGEAPIIVDLATATGTVRFLGEEIPDSLGVRSASCDLNGDGIEDLVLAADDADGPGEARPGSGQVYVVYGRRGSWSESASIAAAADLVIFGQESNDSFGLDTGCGDVNGDGFSDLIVAAGSTDSLGNSRDQAGQAHIIQGGSSLPASIDLLADPQITIWGSGTWESIGYSIGVGDINGDGFDDILFEAEKGFDSTGVVWYAGRVYVVFGRAFWPAEIDLRDESDLVIYGAEENDFLGSTVAAGDLDGDGTDEVVVAAPQADGPGNTKPGAGEIHVFRGRSSWPSEIDLAQETSDMVIVGADSWDELGNTGRDVGVGDLDGDGWGEVLAGAYQGAGPQNMATLLGECGVVEPGATLPTFVDLATESDSVLYGVSAGDYYCAGVFAADANGDLMDDLLCDAVRADGPNDGRERAGEIVVKYGQDPFPGLVDLALEDPDVLVYGPEAQDSIALIGNSDINGDGLYEIVAVANRSETRLPEVFLVSPFDVDLDGVLQLRDNCPRVANAAQADSDGDGVGDLCEGDYDGDGLGDGEDCAPGIPEGGMPAPVQGLVFEASSKLVLEWNTASFSQRYDVIRGYASDLHQGDFGSCLNHLDPDLRDTQFEDTEVPSDGFSFTYLVRGRNLVCAQAGTYGSGSGGEPRDNHNPQTCSD